MLGTLPDEGVLREKFILHRLRQVSRFGRCDIETYLEEQAEADLPDCSHQTVDPDCLWCCLSQSDLFRLPSTFSIDDVFAQALTPASFETGQMRLSSFEPYLPWLKETDSATFYVGRDRFIVMEVEKKRYIFEVRSIKSQPGKSELLCRPCTQEQGYTLLALADLLLAEWMRQTDRSTLARSILVSSLQIQVCQERGRAGEDFDASVAVSADGSKIIKASWVVVYDPKTKVMMFHRPDWFASHKFQIGSYKKRAYPQKHLVAPNPKDINSFSPIATFVRDQLIDHVSEGDQVIIPIGKKTEPVLFIYTHQLQKTVPTGICQVQLP